MKNNHFVSIIVPALNSEKHIKECLNSLDRINYPKDKFEIIVVDSGSTDKTVDIVKRFKATLLAKPCFTISSQRNFGARHAQGDILAFIDSDCAAPSNWLKDALKIIDKSEDGGAVGAEYKLPEGSSWIEKVWDLQIETRRRCGEVDWLPSGNLIVPNDAYTHVNGFNEDLATSEDVDFCRRLKNAGYKIIADNDIAVIHLGNPKTIRDFFMKETWRGRGMVRNFVNSLPKIKLVKAMAFGMLTFISMFGSIIGVINGLINNNWAILIISLSLVWLISFALAIKTLIKIHKRRHLFHLAFLYLVYGLARASCILDYRNWKRKKKMPHISVILYHDIRDDDFNIKEARIEDRPYILKRSGFENQMKWLAANRKKAMIIFDDGWKSNYEIAYPILKRYELRATFFITVNNIGKPEMMTWDEIKEMADNGMEIGSHSMTHRPPIELSDSELEYEMRESKRILQDNLNKKTEFFSSPTGFYDRRVTEIAKKAGYKTVYFSRVAYSEINHHNKPLCLNKIGIKRDYDFGTFKGIVHGDKSVLARMRSRQVMRDVAKLVLGARRYERVRAVALARRGV